MVLVVLAGLVVGGAAALAVFPQARERLLPAGNVKVMGQALVGGPFTLTNHKGKRVTDQDFRGRYMLVFFGFTFCPDVCPSALQVVSAALDKLGPMTRHVEDAMLVLHAISGPDAGDLASVPSKLDFDANASVSGLRVGYISRWMKENPATEVDRAALESVKKVGMQPVEISIPDWPYDSLDVILFAEAAAAFDQGAQLRHHVDE